MKFCFGDIVVIDKNLIGVVVKSWISIQRGHSYYVYVRMKNEVVEYLEKDIQRYMVRHKYLDNEELEYQFNAINGL